MAAWKNKSRKALEQFKAFADSTRRYDKVGRLADHAAAENLLYAANPIYIETTQGGTSPIRGFGAVIWLGAMLACWYGSYAGFRILSSNSSSGGLDILSALLFFLSALILFGSVLPGFLLFFSFFTPTDAVVRFDRKRQVAYKWSDQGLIEIPWAKLTPVVQGMMTSPMQASRTYRAMLVEYAPNGEPRSTNGVPHLMQLGWPSGDEQGALLALEYVRRYMDEGWQAVPRPQQWLRHRPRWRAMFNFVGIVDDWAREEREPSELGKPWGLALFFGSAGLAMIPMQITNWLALQVAPKPRWPRTLKVQHARDLAEIGYRPDGRRAGVADDIAVSPAAASGDPSSWLDRLVACIAIPMALLSPLLFWVGAFGFVPGFKIGIYEAALWSCVLGLGATALALLSIRYVDIGNGLARV